MDESATSENTAEKWQEFVDDLWTSLPHLREELRGGGMYVFIERLHNDYGFPEVEETTMEFKSLLIKAAEESMEGKGVAVYGNTVRLEGARKNGNEGGAYPSWEL